MMDAAALIPPAISSSSSVQEKFITLSSGRVRYLTAGAGEPLLLIHGLLGYSYSWRFNLDALATCATVYAPDLPGTGFSERPASPDGSLCSTANTMLDFLESQGIRSSRLLGSSHGGAAAMMTAALASGRGINISKLVLVSPVNPWSAFGNRLLSLFRTNTAATLFKHVVLHLGPLNDPVHHYCFSRLYGDSGRIVPGTVEAYVKPLHIPGTFDLAFARVRCWEQDLRELEQALPALHDIAALVLWGDRDRAVDPASATKVQAIFRQAELKIIPSTGHLPYEESPEEFNKLVLSFLSSRFVIYGLCVLSFSMCHRPQPRARGFRYTMKLSVICLSFSGNQQGNGEERTMSTVAFDEITTLAEHLARYRAVTLQTLEFIPDDKFDWKPQDPLRSISEQFHHIAQAENFYIHGLLENDWNFERVKKTPGPFTRKHLQELLSSGSALVQDKLAKLAPARVHEVVTVPNVPVEWPLRGWLWYLVEHEVHHKAQIALYLRNLGIVPPFFATVLPHGMRPDGGA